MDDPMFLLSHRPRPVPCFGVVLTLPSPHFTIEQVKVNGQNGQDEYATFWKLVRKDDEAFLSKNLSGDCLIASWSASWDFPNGVYLLRADKMWFEKDEDAILTNLVYG